MANRRRPHRLARRHGKIGKRQVLDPNSILGSTITPTLLQPSSESLPTAPIPSIDSISHTTVTITTSLPLTTVDTLTIPTSQSITPKPSSVAPSSPISEPSTSVTSTPTIPVASPSPSPSPFSTSTLLESQSSSDRTPLITTMSGSIPVTVTIIQASASASASLSPEPQSDTPNSFLQNKAVSGVVFAIVALVAVAGIGSLGYRFYKTMKQRSADRETEEAARAAAKVRVQLDDDDNDDGYGGGGTHNTFPHDMVQLHNEPFANMSDFDTHIGDDLGSGEFDDDGGTNYFENGGSSTGPLRQPTLRKDIPYLQTTFEGSDIGESTPSAHSMRSGESGDHLLLTHSSTMGGHLPDASLAPKRSVLSRSDTSTLSTRSETKPTSRRLPMQSSGSISRAPPGQSRPLSGPFNSSHTPLSTVSRSHSSHLLQHPPLPTLPLPEMFGEGEAVRATPQTGALSDDMDYQGTIGRVLKIANE